MSLLSINPVNQQHELDADYLSLVDLDDAAETEALPEWDDEDDLDDVNGIYHDDLEPLSEYDSELRQPLYVIDEDDATLSNELMVDRWVATSLRNATGIEKERISALLRQLTGRRLRYWLRWVEQQEWNGHSLLLFLRFREHWNANPHWWECSFWDRRMVRWHPTRSRYSLSLDASYELVQRRLGHSPGAVIDESWLGDWLELRLWERGFPSFASFAVFRAGFQLGENWQRHLDWDPADDGDGFRYGQNGLEMRANLYWAYRCGPPLWFLDQDWYDPSEWHDNLGW